LESNRLVKIFRKAFTWANPIEVQGYLILEKSSLPIIMLLLLVTVLPSVVVVEANPGPVPHPPVPNTDLPTLTINTPENPSSLGDNNTAAVNISIIPPDSWASASGPWIMTPTVGGYRMYGYLDGILKWNSLPNNTVSFTGYPDTILKISDSKTGSFNLTGGSHIIRIDVVSFAYSQIGTYVCNLTQNVYFAVDPDSQTISFSESPVQTIKGPYPTATPSPPPTPSPTINSTAEHWVEVARYEGTQGVFVTESFACNYSEWRILYESYVGTRYPMIIPGVYLLNITTYQQGDTANYIDKISEPPTQGQYYYHLIHNTTGSFYLNISTGFSDNYSIIVEQNTDSVLDNQSPITSPTASNTENNSAIGSVPLEFIVVIVAIAVVILIVSVLVMKNRNVKRMPISEGGGFKNER
jgi:hypothetical protein